MTDYTSEEDKAEVKTAERKGDKSISVCNIQFGTYVEGA